MLTTKFQAEQHCTAHTRVILLTNKTIDEGCTRRVYNVRCSLQYMHAGYQRSCLLGVQIGLSPDSNKQVYNRYWAALKEIA